MNGSHILTIYAKESRDMLRDRRTLVSMIVVPTLIMPLLLAVVVMVSLRVSREVSAATPVVMVLGGKDSPAAVDALRAQAGLQVLPEAPGWRALVAEKKLRAAVEIPAGFDAALQRGEAATVKIYHYEGEMRSERAVREVRVFFSRYGENVARARLAEHGLPPTLLRPLEVKAENVAPPEKVGGNMIGGIIPYFFLVLAFTGAMYPALDLTAGEKERGTMETLLCSPVARVDIVLGKFLTILTASFGTVVCTLVSLLLLFTVGGAFLAQRIAAGGSPRAAERLQALVTLDPLGVLAVLGMVLPMLVLFAAALFAIALCAKSFKEAQSYVSPLIVVILLPAMIGLLPGVELNAKLALVPILNVSLASKELVSGVWHWQYLALIFGSSCAYAAAALAVAVKLFNRESVLFRM